MTQVNKTDEALKLVQGPVTQAGIDTMRRQGERDLRGKVVIITGASRGVGKQTALDFAKRGAKVVLAARSVDAESKSPGTPNDAALELERLAREAITFAKRGPQVVPAARSIDPHAELPGTLNETLRELERLGGEAIAVPTDLAREADLKHLVQSAVDAFGGVDILVNNAAATHGEIWNKRFLDLTREEWLYQFDVNVHAPFTLMQAVVPLMERRGGGRIINLSTGSGEVMRLQEEPRKLLKVGEFSLDVPGYYSSKRALDRLGNALAPDLARRNIAVIGMHPGLVSTELVAIRIKANGLDDSVAVPMTVPARMIVYFASCEDPMEYTGRLFWAEREMAQLGIELG